MRSSFTYFYTILHFYFKYTLNILSDIAYDDFKNYFSKQLKPIANQSAHMSQ